MLWNRLTAVPIKVDHCELLWNRLTSVPNKVDHYVMLCYSKYVGQPYTQNPKFPPNMSNDHS